MVQPIKIAVKSGLNIKEMTSNALCFLQLKLKQALLDG